jgi:uncharacterized glyoxalase superfamily protein PhnB
VLVGFVVVGVLWGWLWYGVKRLLLRKLVGLSRLTLWCPFKFIMSRWDPSSPAMPSCAGPSRSGVLSSAGGRTTMAAKKKGKKVKKAAKKARKAARKAAKLGRQKVAATRKASRPKARAFRERQQPETLRLRSASPSFTANDLERSLAFYRDVLGFVVKERWEQDGALHGVELVAGNVTFWLAQDDWKKGRDRVKGQGFRLYCGTTQDLDALARRIESRGGTLLEPVKDQPWGGRDFAVRDPDGFTITFASEA